jgi:hypothetical protein
MKEQFELATTVPHNEPCVQLGQEEYLKWSRLEANTLRDQIYRQLGAPPAGTGIKIIQCPHDFGTYLDLAVVYSPDNEESEEWMLKVESELPEEWDEESKRVLKENGYPIGEYDGSIR